MPKRRSKLVRKEIVSSQAKVMALKLKLDEAAAKAKPTKVCLPHTVRLRAGMGAPDWREIVERQSELFERQSELFERQRLRDSRR